jgi:hypothetical protein
MPLLLSFKEQFKLSTSARLKASRRAHHWKGRQDGAVRVVAVQDDDSMAIRAAHGLKILKDRGNEGTAE